MDNNLYRFNVGSFDCIAIRDGDEGDRNALLVDTGSQRVLIETGNGDALPPPGRILERLRMAGVSPDEVDLVILTHADIDHIGGTTDARGVPVYPRARVVLSRVEWEYWSGRPARMRPSSFLDEETRLKVVQVPLARLEQLRDVLDLVDSGAEIAPGIRALAAAGHTPGHVVIAVESEGERLLFLGDVTYDPIINEELVEVHGVFDVDPPRGAATRERLLEQAAADRTLLMGYHFPFPGPGHLVRDGSDRQWQPLGGGRST